jgi:hypothetical protein
MYKAYRQTQKGKSKYRPEAIEFARDETYNLKQLQSELINGDYRFSGYCEFKVYEPKERIINAPRYRDKIVQIAILNILKDVFYHCFISDSYACIDNKGTHKCAKRINQMLRKARWEYGENAWIIKIDIKKFFYTIDRDILKSFLPKKIKSERLLNLICHIIDSAKEIDALGMPLGNAISHIGSNIYMDKTDQYCKRKLRLKYYARYADDITIVVETKDKATEVLAKIDSFVENKLKLKLNAKKTKKFPISQGVNTVGYKIYGTHMLLRNDSKKKIKRKVKKMPRLISEGKITKRKAEQILNSWRGHASHGNSYNFTRKLLRDNKYIYKDKKDAFKINTKKLEVSNDNQNK